MEVLRVQTQELLETSHILLLLSPSTAVLRGPETQEVMPDPPEIFQEALEQSPAMAAPEQPEALPMSEDWWEIIRDPLLILELSEVFRPAVGSAAMAAPEAMEETEVWVPEDITAEQQARAERAVPEARYI